MSYSWYLQIQEGFDTVIVLEGCDGCGKTTLANHLIEKFGLRIGMRGVSNRDELYKVTRKDTYRALADAVIADHSPRVWDRLFISEFVYAHIVGRPCEFSQRERTFVRNIMDSLGCPMVVCLPPFEVVKANVAKAHQMEGVREGLQDIYNHYDRGALPWPANTIWYDYTGQRSNFATLEEVEEEVAGYIESRKGREAWA